MKDDTMEYNKMTQEDKNIYDLIMNGLKKDIYLIEFVLWRQNNFTHDVRHSEAFDAMYDPILATFTDENDESYSEGEHSKIFDEAFDDFYKYVLETYTLEVVKNKDKKILKGKKEG